MRIMQVVYQGLLLELVEGVSSFQYNFPQIINPNVFLIVPTICERCLFV